MSAAELRKAAETLRRRATDVPAVAVETSGAWDSGVGLRRGNGTWFHLAPTTYERAQRGDFQAASRYIATMHPGVGLALADWLDHEAAYTEESSKVGHLVPHARAQHSKAIAQLINGGAS